MQNFVSIILPVHNGAAYLAETIDSILAQDYTNFELIIVNDRSSDHSVMIAEKYCNQDSRVQLIHNNSGGKLPGTLNIGFEHAKGHYFTWISDDNPMKPNMISSLVEILDVQPHIGLVTANYTNIDARGYEITHVKLNTRRSELVSNNFGISFLYRQEIAKQVGAYNTELFLIEDYDFFLRMINITPRYHVPEMLAYNRIHDAALSQKRQDDIRLKDAVLKHDYLKRNDAPIRRIDYFRIFLKIIRYHNNPLIRLGYIFKCVLFYPDYLFIKIKKYLNI